MMLKKKDREYMINRMNFIGNKIELKNRKKEV